MSALPRKSWSGIEDNINKACNRVIQATCIWSMPTDVLIEKLFPYHVLKICRDAFDYASYTNIAHRPYTVLSVPALVSLRIKFEKRKRVSPKPDYFTVPDELVEFCQHVNEVRDNYTAVRAVARWMFDNAANGATVREYCPWISSVIHKEYEEDLYKGTVREPAKIGTMLPLIRASGNLMSNALLLPKLEYAPETDSTLYFYGYTHALYKTEVLYYVMYI